MKCLNMKYFPATVRSHASEVKWLLKIPRRCECQPAFLFCPYVSAL